MSNIIAKNYFTIFLQAVDIANSLLVFIKINITFSFINNHLPHQQFVNFFVKKFISQALFIKN